MTKLANAYVSLTELPLPVRFDLQTLDTLGVLDDEDSLPKDNSWESAHPHHDAAQKCNLNYIVDFGRLSHYLLYRVEDGLAERKMLARIPVENPSYMHTFAMTENYVIFTEFPLVVNPLDIMLSKQAFIKNFKWQPERGTRFSVVERKSGNIATSLATKPFFAFHHVNAFENNGGIYLDIVTYKDAEIVTGDSFYLNSLKGSRDNPQTKLERFFISLENGTISSEVLVEKSTEFPRINERLDGKPYRYAYLVALKDKLAKDQKVVDSEGLYKVDTLTKEVLEWHEDGCSAGEPVFIEAPNATTEDEGVVLAVILDLVRKDSFLLLSDAKNFKELARAKTPHQIPVGLHGQFFFLKKLQPKHFCLGQQR